MSTLTSFPNTSSLGRQWALSTSKPARWCAPPTTPSIRQNPRRSRTGTPICTTLRIRESRRSAASHGRYHAFEAVEVCLGIVEHKLRSESHVQFVDGLDAMDQSFVCEIAPRTL